MKNGGDKVNKKSNLVRVLVSLIIILVLILGYGVYGGFKAKTKLTQLNEEKNQLISERDSIKADYDELYDKYELIRLDIQNIYKSCLNEGPCKGHFPEVSWYCNNVGDEANDPSHICVCDSSCNMKATEIQ